MCLPCCFSSLADPDVQPAVQRLGRRLRRPSRRRRDDRPRGPRRRPPHPQRRHLPTPQPRHRHPRHSRLSRTEPVASFSSVGSASFSSVADTPSAPSRMPSRRTQLQGRQGLSRGVRYPRPGRRVAQWGVSRRRCTPPTMTQMNYRSATKQGNIPPPGTPCWTRSPRVAPADQGNHRSTSPTT